jgi:hypothetical protein
MSRTVAEIEALEWKLSKRGFLRNPKPELCKACNERAVFSYSIPHTNIGGREIEWCHNCQEEHGYRHPGGGDRVEEDGFDLETFLG